ncbi:MAG: hypothetical protein HOP13_13900 [Alphaproteobacteria bacterium]|nr:hypothetical protein [Alphaproteobacteria bacterium]
MKSRTSAKSPVARVKAKELLKRLGRLRGRLPAGFKFDRLDANKRSSRSTNRSTV